MLYPISLKHIANITKKISRKDLRELVESELEIKTWHLYSIVEKFIKENSIDVNQANTSLQIELEMCREGKTIFYDIYTESNIVYDTLREVLEEFMGIPVILPHDSDENVPIDPQFDDPADGIPEFQHRSLLDRKLFNMTMSNKKPDLDYFSLITRTRRIVPSMFSFKNGKYHLYLAKTPVPFSEYLTRLPITRDQRQKLIKLFNGFNRDLSLEDPLVFPLMYNTSDLEWLYGVYPEIPWNEQAFVSPYEIGGYGQLNNIYSILNDLEIRETNKINDKSKFFPPNDVHGFNRSAYFRLITWDSIEPPGFLQTEFVKRKYSIEPSKQEKLKSDIIQILGYNPNDSSDVQIKMLPSSLVWMTVPEMSDSLLKCEITPSNKRFLNMICRKSVNRRLLQNVIQTKEYADILVILKKPIINNGVKYYEFSTQDYMNAALMTYYSDLSQPEIEQFLNIETNRLYGMFEELIKIEIDRHHKGMITVYHCRDLSMKFFDLISEALGYGKFNKAKSHLDGTAYEKYKRLEDVVFEKYSIMRDFRDSDPNKFQFFDGAPETALYLTSCSYTMFSNFSRAYESSIQLLLENKSVSSVLNKFDLIIRNIDYYGIHKKEIIKTLRSLFKSFTNQTSEKIRGSPKYMGQLISIGIPVNKIDNYGYDAYEGGLIKESTAGSIKRQLGSWPLSLVKPGITENDKYDINRAQCRLIDIDFNDPNINVQYFEDFPEDISRVYLELIKLIFQWNKESLIDVLFSFVRMKSNVPRQSLDFLFEEYVDGILSNKIVVTNKKEIAKLFVRMIKNKNFYENIEDYREDLESMGLESISNFLDFVFVQD